MSNTRRASSLLAGLGLMACLGLRCSRDETRTGQPGERAPGFSLESLDGPRLRLEDLTGRGPVLVNFWATWCAPCKAEIPFLNEVHERFQARGLRIVGISVEEARETVVAFTKMRRVSYTILLDPEAQVARKYDVIGYPTTLFIDGSGTVLFRQTRALDEEGFDVLANLLKGGAASPIPAR